MLPSADSEDDPSRRRQKVEALTDHVSHKLSETDRGFLEYSTGHYPSYGFPDLNLEKECIFF